MSPQTFYTQFQKEICVFKLLDHWYEKHLDDNLSFILSPRNTFKITCIMVIVILIPRLWKTSIFSKAIMMLIHPRRLIGMTTSVTIKDKPLINITLLPPLVMMMTQHLHQPLHLPIFPTTNLVIDLALVSNVMPVHREWKSMEILQRHLHHWMDWLQNLQSYHLYPDCQRFWWVMQNCQISKTPCTYFIVHWLFQLATTPQ